MNSSQIENALLNVVIANTIYKIVKNIFPDEYILFIILVLGI